MSYVPFDIELEANLRASHEQTGTPQISKTTVTITSILLVVGLIAFGAFVIACCLLAT